MSETSGGERDALRELLKRAAVALKSADVAFALAGGYAAWARGGPEPDHDADLVLLPADVDAAERALTDAGLDVQHPAEDWLFKVFDDDVMIDVIFEVTGAPVGRDMLNRATTLDVLSVHMPVLSATDVLVTKMGALSEQSCDFGKVLPVARSLREQVDWPSLSTTLADNPYATACLDLLRRLDIVPGDSPEPGRSQGRSAG